VLLLGFFFALLCDDDWCGLRVRYRASKRHRRQACGGGKQQEAEFDHGSPKFVTVTVPRSANKHWAAMWRRVNMEPALFLHAGRILSRYSARVQPKRLQRTASWCSARLIAREETYAKSRLFAYTSVAGGGVPGPPGSGTGSSSGVLPGNSSGRGGSPGSRIGGGFSGWGLPGGSSRGGSVGVPGLGGGTSGGGSIGIVDNEADLVAFRFSRRNLGRSALSASG